MNYPLKMHQIFNIVDRWFFCPNLQHLFKNKAFSGIQFSDIYPPKW